jgi:hypothetical protein
MLDGREHTAEEQPCQYNILGDKREKKIGSGSPMQMRHDE